MPKQYEAIRDRFMSKGMDEDEAQMHAAKIYNSKHPGRPVTGKHKKKKKKGKKKREVRGEESYGKGLS